MTVDTLSLARELRAANVEGAQAEAIAAAIGKAVVETSATKADLVQLNTGLRGEIVGLRTELTAEIALVRAEIRSSIEALRSTMPLWFIGTTLTLAAIILAALKL